MSNWIWIVVCLGIVGVERGLAFDVSPSRETSTNFNESKGKTPNLFTGDPERIKRANEVLREEFELKVVLVPEKIYIPAEQGTKMKDFKAGIEVLSQSKIAKRFSFANSQRIDLIIRSAQGQELYRWSFNKQFAQVMATSLVMPKERLRFLVDIPASKFPRAMQPGTYKVETFLVGYPEFTAMADVEAVVGEPPAPVEAAPAPVAPERLPDASPMMPSDPAMPMPAPENAPPPSL